MKYKYFAALVLLLAGLLFYNLRSEEVFSRSAMAMNTIIRIGFKGHDNTLLDDAFALLSTLDNSLSMYNPSSDISRINDLAGISGVSVPDYVVDVVRRACLVHDSTGGVFNPLIGSLTRIWKINRDDGLIPSQESIDEAVKLSDISNLVLDSDSIFLKHKGCLLDLGGIAKGFAGDAIAELFRRKGIKSALIDLGGNICVVGKNFEGNDWRVGIRNPLNPHGSPVLIVNVRDCSVVTSGNYERYKIHDGKKYSHFFDPKTGQSVMNDLLSVTVIDPDGSLADGLATAFMTMGFDNAKAMISKLNVKAVLIRNDGSIHASRSLKDIITAPKSAIELF